MSILRPQIWKKVLFFQLYEYGYHFYHNLARILPICFNKIPKWYLHVGIPNFEKDVRLVIKIEIKSLNFARSLQIWSFKRTTWRKFWIKGHWLKLGKKGKIPLFTHLLISFFWPEDQVYSALIYAFKMFIGFHSSFYLHQQANLMSKEYLYANIP